jgi:hypothetical protein
MGRRCVEYEDVVAIRMTDLTQKGRWVDDCGHTQVRRISQLARDLGVHGTPSFLLNNKLVEGALQWSDIERMVAGRPPVSPGKRRLPHVPVNYSHPVLQARARAQAEAEMAAAAAEAEEAARAAAEAEQEGMCVDEGPIIRS